MMDNLPRHVESTIRVRYAETDQMGIAHHASYIDWFEIGRTDLCRSTGLSYREIEQRGFFLVVTEVTCLYRRSFRYDEEVVIRTRVGEIGSRSLQFDYELRGIDGVVGATGHSRHLWVERRSNRPVRPPEEIVTLFAKFLPS